MRKPEIEAADIKPDTLLFLIDDTGHETLAGNHTVYGLGGIALRAGNNQPQLWPAWKNLRALVNGDALGIMHLIQFALGILNGDDLSWRPIFASVDRQRRRL